MKQTNDSPSFCPMFRVLDPDITRRSNVQELVRSCGLSVEPISGDEELETFPDTYSLVLSHDSADERADQLVDTCVARGHGVVLYREDHELPRVVDLLARGAASYIRWPFDCDQLRQMLRTVERTGLARTRFFALHARARVLIEQLTRRQRQVLALVCSGRTSQEIASVFGLSVRTVELHRAGALAKLKVGSASAMRLGIYAGLDWHEPWPADCASEPVPLPGGAVATAEGQPNDFEA